MLGEPKTEQFVIRTYQDHKLISDQRIHDPFIRCTVTVGISRWDLFKAMFRKQYETKIHVHVDGSEGITRAIMMLDTEQIERETASMLEARRVNRERRSGENHNFCQTRNA